MFETARMQLRETVVRGDSIADVDVKVEEATRWLEEEPRAALWLYAWSLANTRDPLPPVLGARRVVG
jgi:hypothetical protein